MLFRLPAVVGQASLEDQRANEHLVVVYRFGVRDQLCELLTGRAELATFDQHFRLQALGLAAGRCRRGGQCATHGIELILDFARRHVASRGKRLDILGDPRQGSAGSEHAGQRAAHQDALEYCRARPPHFACRAHTLSA
ncbi:hypothetical protein [Niveibacterium microcysteis]|uniref:Uncharacterized protein n=1 Tax=Niveibacterium microcysteis TaxID=2811415 RepID=A0ABX7M3W9_9RHOO|nr:hypothetical protein [Niveibacterium microcysteis]QSI76449.1 hypothetical protein JY500_18625 [Niveibacterium microcysteis]